MRVIARAIGRPHTTVRGYVAVLRQTGAGAEAVAVAVVAGGAGGHLPGPGGGRVVAGDRRRGWVGRPRRSPGRSRATVVVAAIGRVAPMSGAGGGRCGPSNGQAGAVPSC